MLIQETDSLFVSEIKERHYFIDTRYYVQGDSRKNNYKVEYFVNFINISTGEYEPVYKTKLSRNGLSINDKFKINNKIIKIIDKFYNPNESITYVIDDIVLRDEDDKKEAEKICEERNKCV